MLDPMPDPLAQAMEIAKAHKKELSEIVRKAMAEREAELSEAMRQAQADDADLRRLIEFIMRESPPARPG